MAKITISDITAQFSSTAAINARFQQIEDELNDKVLYRDNPGSEPNQMVTGTDANFKRQINFPDAVNPTEPVTLGQLEGIVGTDLGTGFGTVEETQVATALQTVFTLADVSVGDSDSLTVYADGLRLSNEVWTLTGTDTVTLDTGVPVDTVMLFVVINSQDVTGSGIKLNRIEKQTGSQVSASVSTLTAISYTKGNDSLLVYLQGVLQSKDADYTETTTTSITWIGELPTPADLITFMVGSIASGEDAPSGSAADITYDNGVSGLTADDVQDAIDELAAAAAGGGQPTIVDSADIWMDPANATVVDPGVDDTIVTWPNAGTWGTDGDMREDVLAMRTGRLIEADPLTGNTMMVNGATAGAAPGVSFTVVQAFTMFIVARLNSGATVGNFCGNSFQTLSTEISYDADRIYTTHLPVGSTMEQTWTPERWMVMGVQIDGLTDSFSQFNQNAKVLVNGDTGVRDSSPYTIGANGSDAGDLNGDTGDYLFFGTPITAAEFDEVMAWLCAKWLT